MDTSPIDELSDDMLKLELVRLSADVGDLLSRREDCMDALYERGLVKGGGGAQPLADSVAIILGLPSPKIDIPRRPRDETGFWTCTRIVASLVEAFIKQGVPE